MTLHKLYGCTHLACDRWTTATWCCENCEQAETSGYDVAVAGPIRHTETCDRSHRERGPSTEYQQVMHRAALGIRRPET